MLSRLQKVITSYTALIYCIMLVTAASATGQQDEAGWLDDRVTVRFQDELMSTVLGKISQQTGIAILYAEKLADQKVTGHYKDIKFSEAINRLFSETNKSIQVFRNEKKIIVKTFGAKQFILAGNVTDSTDSEDESEGMTIAELRKMHARQYKEYRERIADDNEVLEGGMTRGEVRAMQKKQYAEYKKRIADDNEVLEGGMTRGEVRAMQKKQYAEYKKRSADDNEVLEGGMTRGKVHAMQKKQYAEYKKRSTDDNEVLEGGMTRGELRIMNDKQYREYKSLLSNPLRKLD